MDAYSLDATSRTSQEIVILMRVDQRPKVFTSTCSTCGKLRLVDTPYIFRLENPRGFIEHGELCDKCGNALYEWIMNMKKNARSPLI